MAEYTLTHTGEEVDAAVEGWQTAQAQADATAADIAEGKKAITKDGLVTGTMDGGGGSGEDISTLVRGTISSYSGNESSIRDYAFYKCVNLKSINLPNLLNIGDHSFAFCEALYSLECTNVNYADSYAFGYCYSLEEINLPNLNAISNNMFYECDALKSANFPSVTEIGNLAFRGCSSIESIVFPLVKSIGNNVFVSCGSLVSLILPGEELCKLSSSGSFSGTPIDDGTGYIYVPSSLYGKYKFSSNWTKYADQFRKIEDYPDIVNIIATMEAAA